MALYESNGYNETFPIAGFNFAVTVGGASSGHDSEFQEVSGLEVEMEVEEIAEGGVNTHKHRVPGRTKYRNLVLKRGLIKESSELASWCSRTLQGDLNAPIELRDIIVELRDEKQQAVMSWSFVKAYPIKWNVSNFNAEQNGIVTETLEFVFQSFRKN
ncbi:MAG: phage tail protein [Bacteroidetes bacterium]|nr:MAG: phage tail protein [Bacteroidota bacterium]